MPTIDEIMAVDFEAEEAEIFQKDDDQAEESRPADEAMPHLPDGIGLDFEDVRMMISKKHNLMLGHDEPILMELTLLNAHLGEMEKLHKRHNEAVTKIMADQSAKYIAGVVEQSHQFVAGVKNSTDALGKALAASSVDTIRDIFNSHATALNSNRNNARWCAAIMAVAALVNVAAMVWR